MKALTSNAFCLLLVASAGIGCSSSGGDSDPNDSDVSTTGAAQPSLDAEVQGQSQESLVVFPDFAAAGATISVTGEGFGNHCGVEVFLDADGGVSLGSVPVTQEGSFAAQFIIPDDTEAGERLIVAEGLTEQGGECSDPSNQTADAPLEVTASMPLIILDALEGRPGLTVDVQGRGFCPAAECSDVTILIDGQSSAEGISVEVDGTFSAEAFVPAIDAAGPVAVVAIQLDSTGTELRAFGELVVTVKPDQAPPVIN